MIFSLQSLHNGNDMTTRLWDWRLQIRNQRKVNRLPPPPPTPMDTRYQRKMYTLSKLTTWRIKKQHESWIFRWNKILVKKKSLNVPPLMLALHNLAQIQICLPWSKHFTIMYKYNFDPQQMCFVFFQSQSKFNNFLNWESKMYICLA